MKDQRSENVAMQYASGMRQIGLKYTVCQDLKSKFNALYSPATRASAEAARSPDLRGE